MARGQGAAEGLGFSSKSGLSQDVGHKRVQAQPAAGIRPVRVRCGLPGQDFTLPHPLPPGLPDTVAIQHHLGGRGRCAEGGEAPTSSFICTSSRAVATWSRCLLADSTWLQYRP